MAKTVAPVKKSTPAKAKPAAKAKAVSAERPGYSAYVLGVLTANPKATLDLGKEVTKMAKKFAAEKKDDSFFRGWLVGRARILKAAGTKVSAFTNDARPSRKKDDLDL